MDENSISVFSDIKSENKFISVKSRHNSIGELIDIDDINNNNNIIEPENDKNLILIVDDQEFNI